MRQKDISFELKLANYINTEDIDRFKKTSFDDCGTGSVEFFGLIFEDGYSYSNSGMNTNSMSFAIVSDTMTNELDITPQRNTFNFYQENIYITIEYDSYKKTLSFFVGEKNILLSILTKFENGKEFVDTSLKNSNNNTILFENINLEDLKNEVKAKEIKEIVALNHDCDISNIIEIFNKVSFLNTPKIKEKNIQKPKI